MNNNHSSCPHYLWPALCLLAWLTGTSANAQSVTPPQRLQATHLSEEVLAAGKLYADGNYSASATKITDLQVELSELLKDSGPELQRLLKPTYQRIARAHGLLELKGAELSPLPNWETLTAARDSKPVTPGTLPPSATSNISFVRQLAPQLSFLGVAGLFLLK